MADRIALPLSHPHLIPEWHPTKNSAIEKYSKGSTEKVWWKCIKNNGHEWEAVISSRVRGTGCPYCSGRKATSGLNDVATLHPYLAPEWHPANIVPLNTLRPGSQEKGLWVCSKGHEWQAKIRDRVNGSGCLVCAGKQVLIGYNDVATTQPNIALLWDFDKNILMPTDVTKNSEKTVFFRCDKGHSWQNTVRRQSEVASGCSFCAGRKAVDGENDLVTTYPEIAKDWHPTKNGGLLPSMVTGSMDKRVWWLGKCNHEWETWIYSRTTQKQGCPICSGRQVLIGYNDFKITHPKVAAEWDYELNNDLLPEMFTRGSNEKVNWKCDKGHTWISKITDRTTKKSGCPNCSASLLISKGEQDIADFIRSNNIQVIQSDRKTLKGLELDIFAPEISLAIEFNGLYWHTEEKGKGKYYHHDKWDKCRKAGIQLIQIWEDEWRNNPEQVKVMLLHKMGLNRLGNKIFARQTTITKVSLSEAKEFLKTNHIQGFSVGTHYIGLKKDGILRAIIVLRKESNNTLNIIRYATNCSVVGGFTKLLSHVEKEHTPSRFITFSDNCVSDGGLYKNNGFIVDKELEPDYRYVIGNERKHKFGYRLKKFRDDPNLQWIAGLTERELAALNGIERIWDAGKTRWVKNV